MQKLNWKRRQKRNVMTRRRSKDIRLKFGHLAENAKSSKNKVQRLQIKFLLKVALNVSRPSLKDDQL